MGQTMKRKNTRRIEVEAAIRAHGPISSQDLQTRFGVKQPSMQDHLSALRDQGTIYLADWAAPEGQGNWTPLYAIRRRAEDRDIAQPPSARRAKGELPVVYEEDCAQVIVRAEGVRNDHALMARARFEEAGMWGGLVPGMRYSI